MTAPQTEKLEKETGRVEAFSDGVFAIAITLLVLDLKIPHGVDGARLHSSLLEQWPSFVAFLTSFAILLVIWMNHHNLFGHIARTNPIFMLSNGLLLLSVTFLPFPTSLVAEYYGHPGEHSAAILYCGTLLMMAFAFNLIWRYAAHKHRLLGKNVTADQVKTINRQYLMGPVFFGLAFVLSFVQVTASLLLTAALAIYYAITASRSQC